MMCLFNLVRSYNLLSHLRWMVIRTAVLKRMLIEEEYKKTGIKPSDITILRQWLKTQPHLPEQHITDLDLLLTYHCCFQSTERAKQLLDLNLTLRTHFTGIFKDRAVDDSVINVLNAISIIPLAVPAIDKNYKVIYYSLVDVEIKNFVFIDTLRTTLMLMDMLQYEDGASPGYVILVDLKDVPLGIVSKLEIQSVQQIMYYIQDAIPVRIKAIHCINPPPVIDKLMMLVKPFLKKELTNVIRIHSPGTNTIEELIPKTALPKEAGGNYKSYEEARKEMIEKFLAHKDFFAEENKKRVVESLRPGKPKTITDIFGGVEGSFKQLDID